METIHPPYEQGEYPGSYVTNANVNMTNCSVWNDNSTWNASSNPSLTNATINSHLAPSVAIQILSRIHLIALPTIAILGTVSNLLAFCIFASKTLRRTSCSLYLAARSISDTGFLMFLFITWLGDATRVPVVHVVVVCQAVVFGSYVFGFLSVWLVVFITVENYVRICLPFSVSKFCTVQKARQVIAVLVVMSFAIYQFSLWTTQITDYDGQPRCGIDTDLMAYVKGLMYADLIITLVLPSIIILFLMAAITVSLVRSLKRQSRLRGKNLPSTSMNGAQLNNIGAKEGRTPDGSGGQKNKSPSCMRCSSPQAKVTRLLFAVSFTFLVLSLPSHIVRLRLAMLAMVEQQSSSPHIDELFHVVFQILYYVSFAVNLLVYLFFGDSFRNVFIETYISCFMDKSPLRRRSEVSHTSYTVVRMEQPENPQREEETALIT